MKLYPWTYYDNKTDEVKTIGYFTEEQIQHLINQVYNIPTNFYKETVIQILRSHNSISIDTTYVDKLKGLILNEKIDRSIEEILK